MKELKLICLLIGLCTIKTAFGQKPRLPKTDTIKQVSPPFLGFYSKLLNNNGILVRSSSRVSDSALKAGSERLTMMLSKIPVVRQNLSQWGVELHVIGKDEETSDLPEHSEQKGKIYTDNLGNETTIDKRSRGLGGFYTSCGEENLLGLPSDRYLKGQDICIHEFAHTIMLFGLSDSIRSLISDQFKQSMLKGLWSGAYASVNEGEYWAELSMWYFGQHGEFLKGTQYPSPGPEALKNYDKGGFDLLEKIYSGKIGCPEIKVTPVSKQSLLNISISGIGGEKAKFLILNLTSKAVKLFWFDFNGKPVFYGEIPAFYANINETFTKHLWEITTIDGKLLGNYLIGSLNSKIVIEN